MLLCDQEQFRLVSKGKVALCTGGQVNRLIPDLLKEPLIDANPLFTFYHFFNLQVPGTNSTTVYWKGSELRPRDSSYAGMDESSIRHRLIQTLEGKNSIIASVALSPPGSREEWVAKIPLTDSRIFMWIPKEYNHNILNMYSSHPKCVEQIKAYELDNSITFDYVISSREDAFFFKPYNLSTLVLLLPSRAAKKCDMLYKSCLSWGGFAMRSQLYTREAAMVLLGNRMDVLHRMIVTTRKSKGKFLRNPETFEMFQAARAGLVGCPVSVELFPAAAARYNNNGSICLERKEVFFGGKLCYPSSSKDFIKTNMCG